MTINISDALYLAAKKHAATQLRKISIPDLREFAPHTLEWGDLHTRKKELGTISKTLLDQITESTPNNEARSIERAFDAIIVAQEACVNELDYRGESGDRGPRAHGGNPGRPTREDAEDQGDGFNGNAMPDSQWRNSDGKSIRVYQPNENLAERSDSALSFGSAIRAVALGPRNEAERRSLSEGTDGAGGFTVPAPLARQFIDALRAQSIVIRAGAVTVPMDSDTLQIAKLASDPAFAWRAELAAVGTGDPTFSRVLFTAKSCAVLVKCSRELLEDSVNAEQMLLQAFANAAALEIDATALCGTGTGNQPTGILNAAGINTVSMGTNGAAFADYDKWLDALYELELDNIPGPFNAAMHPRTARDLRKLKTGLTSDKTPLVMPRDIAAITQRISTTLPIDETQGTAVDASSVIIGNFSNVMLGVRDNLRIMMLNERYADTLEVGFIAHMRLDVQLQHAQAFCAINGVIPA